MLHASVEPAISIDSTIAAAVLARIRCTISLEFALERRQDVGVGDLGQR